MSESFLRGQRDSPAYSDAVEEAKWAQQQARLEMAASPVG
jgi:hypothetical protein